MVPGTFSDGKSLEMSRMLFLSSRCSCLEEERNSIFIIAKYENVMICRVGAGVGGEAKELARQTAVDQPLPMKD